MALLRIETDADRVHRLPLCCDPAVEAANDADAIRAFLKSGDPSGLTLPDDAEHIRVRGLTPQEVEAAESEAGMMPFLGQRLINEAGGDDPAELFRKLEELDGADADAVARAMAWGQRRKDAMVRRGLVGVESWGEEGEGEMLWKSIDHALPPTLRRALLNEAWEHIARLSHLGAPGKD